MEGLTTQAIVEELGERLKLARLNVNKTQVELAKEAGVSRKAVLNAEQGKATLTTFVALLRALKLTEQLQQFLPLVPISPIQLAKMQGKQRKRASTHQSTKDDSNKSAPDEVTIDW